MNAPVLTLAIDAEAVRRTAEATGWSIEGHVERVYRTFRFEGRKPPSVHVRKGERHPAIQQSLIDWNADLGSRDCMDWAGFLGEHQRILGRLADVPRLGQMTPGDVLTVASVVEKLDSFKGKSGGSLVFGSKAAHFHFPGKVPVMSSEVRNGLAAVERRAESAVRSLLHQHGQAFRFGSPAAKMESYRNYVRLGNHLARELDCEHVFGAHSRGMDLHAKAVEWWVIGAALAPVAPPAAPSLEESTDDDGYVSGDWIQEQLGTIRELLESMAPSREAEQIKRVLARIQAALEDDA